MDELRAEIATTLTRAAVEEAIAQAVTARIDFDIARINVAAMEWAHKYTFELVKGIDATTRRLLSNATRQFLETPGMTVGQLTELIAPAFGDARAGMIAVTETTRAFSQGTTVYQEMLKEAGIEMRRVWRSSADEGVCEYICDPLDGQPEEMWGGYDGPPAHPNCRCFTVLEYVKK
jgi:AcrR family transcriptional regulator